MVRDGSSPSDSLLARLTGPQKNNPRFVVSTSNIIYFYFHTSLGISNRGFRIRWALVVDIIEDIPDILVFALGEVVVRMRCFLLK